MFRKMIILLVMVLICSGLFGCGNGGTTEMMGALNQTVTGVNSDNHRDPNREALTEMKHWAYSSEPSAPVAAPEAGGVAHDAASESGSAQGEADCYESVPVGDNYSDQAVTIQLITTDDLQRIMGKLIELGFMDQYATSQDEFQKAVAAFQKENGLSATGVLDSATLQILKK